MDVTHTKLENLSTPGQGLRSSSVSRMMSERRTLVKSLSSESLVDLRIMSRLRSRRGSLDILGEVLDEIIFRRLGVGGWRIR